MATQCKAIEEYISKHRSELTKLATASMKHKRDALGASTAKSRSKEAGLLAPIVQALQGAREHMSREAAPAQAPPIKLSEQKQLALRFA